jgi:hypothetical protein
LTRESPELIAITAVNISSCGRVLELDNAFQVGCLQPGAGQRDGRIKLQCTAIALLGPCSVGTELVDGAFLAQQRCKHAETVQLVLADQGDRAGAIYTFEHRAHRAEYKIASLMEEDQGRIEISCPDELDNLRDGLDGLLDHSLDVVALNDAHLVKSICRWSVDEASVLAHYQLGL